MATREEGRRRREAIAEAVRGGLTPPQAARKFQVTLSTVEKSCREHEVSARFNRIPKCMEILAELLRGELTQAEIATKLDMGVTLVSWTAKQAALAGIEFRKRDARRREVADVVAE